MEKLSIKTIVAIGIGAAMFIILAHFASIPTPIPNTSLETSYGLLAFMSLLYGPVAGFAIGFIGHLVNDTITYGTPWMSWVISSGIVGLIIGFLSNKIKINEGKFGLKDILTFNGVQIIANAIAWLVIAPVLDILIYAEPVNKVFVQGAVAACSNIITVGVITTLLAAAYSKTRTKKGSLKAE